MDDDVVELVTRSQPRRLSDDPSVSASTRELVHSAARAGRRRSRRKQRTGFMVGIAIVAAACATVIPVVAGQPPKIVDAIATEEPEPANAPPLGPAGGQDSTAASASPESVQECKILSRIVSDLATADENLGENLETARDFLAEEDLDSLPAELAEASVSSGPEPLSAAQLENQVLTEVETALGEAGLLLPGVRVETTLTCSHPGAP